MTPCCCSNIFWHEPPPLAGSSRRQNIWPLRWPEAYAIPFQEVPVVAECLVSRIGVPNELHGNQGRNFESQVFAEVCHLISIKKTHTTPLHPQSDGLVVPFSQMLLTSYHQHDWDLHLLFVLLAYCSAVHRLHPAALMFGRELWTPVELVLDRPSDSSPRLAVS
ncbi:hypothetical protein SKAU_G00003840 [Synaphobranchus kaupii]|uniref:Integrase catalytic domain-containing protein n=1 Tax=Synaphobranchus kaupii TaxID=118154 RepID=A0A9Q1G8Q4_SYNKA|nr:hypothetical protein SKAU_G00003840 [Synaphobranchus kaupii]